MKKLIFAVGIALALLAITIPAATHAEQGLLDGQNFIFVNYIGQEMFFDLDDQTYTIPGTDTMPEGGQLILTLPNGEHKYAANVPGVGGSAGEFSIGPNLVFARAARVEQTNPVVKEGILVEEPQDYVYVFDFDPFATAAEPVKVVDNWLPAVAAPGQSSLVWVNYAPDQLTVDLNGTIYTVASPQDDIPGRLQIDVTPGEYTYTASVPYGSINGNITPIAGQVVGLNVTADPLPAPEYDVGEEFDLHPTVTLRLLEEELTTQAVTAALPESVGATGPQTLPETGGVPAPILPDTPAVAGGLFVKNYVGDTLVFTINNQTFNIPSNGEQLINLPSGSYTYTASTPFAATSGTINSGTGQVAELSVITNIAHNALTVFE
jgi:hypothetical protein